MRTPNILLLEDEALIAMDVETMLTDIKAGSVTSIASCTDALERMAAAYPDPVQSPGRDPTVRSRPLLPSLRR
jgi:AmiR/NasT family two-component response regulator